jgi:enoyl-CoA hydratase
MIKDYKTLKINIEDEIILITINRPEKLNALSVTVLSELKQLLSDLKLLCPMEIKGAILTGAGDKAFIAGADIKAMSLMSAEEGREFASLGQSVGLLLEKLPIPIIACVNGFALGGGCEIAISCDFIYATKNAIFGQPEVNLGLIPGFGGTQRLVKFLGVPLSKELIYTGRNIKISEAVQRGLVLREFETREEMIEKAKETLNIIKKKSPLAIQICKKVINEGESESIEEGLKIEARGFESVFGSEDKKEGISAFLEKRKPSFSGR